MAIFDASRFNPVLAGLAGEQCDPDDAVRFRADNIAPAYNVGHKSTIPSVKLGAAKGQHRGGRIIGGPAEQGEAPTVTKIDALTSAEKRDVVIYAEEAYAHALGSTPAESRRLWEAVCINKAARELQAYSESELETWLKGSWSSAFGVSEALADGARFDDADAAIRNLIIDKLQKVEADTVIVDQESDRLLRRHPDYRGQLGDNERDGIKRPLFVELMRGDHDRDLDYVVLDAQDDPSQPNNPIVGSSSGFFWAGRLRPSLPRSAAQARNQLTSHNFAFLRGFHTAVSNPVLARGARLNSRTGDEGLNSALAGITIVTTYRDDFVTKATVYSTGKFTKVNKEFAMRLTNTWVSA